MAEVNKFESYAGGAGVYFEVELDPRFPSGIISPDFSLTGAGVTVEYQMFTVDSGNSWLVMTVPAGGENHLVIEESGVRRVRIENTDSASGPYQLAAYQLTRLMPR